MDSSLTRHPKIRLLFLNASDHSRNSGLFLKKLLNFKQKVRMSVSNPENSANNPDFSLNISSLV